MPNLALFIKLFDIRDNQRKQNIIIFLKHQIYKMI